MFWKFSEYRKKIPRAAVYLGLVSFMNDVASEAIYPVLPLFLTQVVGMSASVLGFYEGIAESFAALTKYFAGAISDRLKHRDRIVFVVAPDCFFYFEEHMEHLRDLFFIRAA